MIRILTLRDLEAVQELLTSVQVDKVGVGMMMYKASHHLLYIDAVKVPAANIIKQEMLSLGGDAALHRQACDFSIPETPCLLMGTHQQFLRLCKKLQLQPFGLKKIGKDIRQTLNDYLSIPPPLKVGTFTLNFSKRPIIMGILNVTPDSFSGDALGKNKKKMLQQAEQMIAEGADVLDVGGESTRPGHTAVSVEEELSRVVPAIKVLVKHCSRIPLSVDTSKAEVAKQALEAGAHIINDVWGLQQDPNIVKLVKILNAPFVIMHNQDKAVYRDVVGDVLTFFHERLHILEKEGISVEKVILDPGIGFGKTPEQNLRILQNLREFRIFGRPLLLGTSRKSFIQHVSGAAIGKRLPGTLASLVLGLAGGFHIFRVHDVAEARQALDVGKAVLEGGNARG